MMKNFLILVFACIAIPFFSQDSLLMKNGEIKTGIIREDDGTFLSLSSLDSSVKEIQLIAKKLSFLALDLTALDKVLSLIILVFMPLMLSKKTMSKPSWLIATPRPFLPITTPLIAYILSH